MIKTVFAPGNDSVLTGLALLALRAWLGLSMLVLHGVTKLKDFGKLAPDFPDPLGVGHSTSLALVVFAEFFCSMALVLGLTTRFVALILAFNMSVAFFIILKGSLTGGHNGEVAFIYLAGYLALFLAGAGRFSIDKALFGKSGKVSGKD